MTRERPILFSAPMVRAILEGRKTMTRRVVKVPWVGRETCQPYEPHYIIEDGVLKNLDEYGHYIPVHCPYGQPGDRLWVRETALYWQNIKGPCSVAAYAADGYELEPGEKWTPSIFMPRWASRITLEITAVRVERLQDISEEDSKREGFPDVVHFYELWTILNGKESWRANPWVWVLEFKRVEAQS